MSSYVDRHPGRPEREAPDYSIIKLWKQHTVRRVFQVLSWGSLILTVLPSVLFFAGLMDLDRVKWVMFISTIVWFAATPFWMGRSEKCESTGAA